MLTELLCCSPASGLMGQEDVSRRDHRELTIIHTSHKVLHGAPRLVDGMDRSSFLTKEIESVLNLNLCIPRLCGLESESNNTHRDG